MLARPAIICPRCEGEEFEYPVNPRPEGQAICKRCRAACTYDELDIAADLRFGKDVDTALSNVRGVNRRYPVR